MAGFGDFILAYLATVPQATTDDIELALKKDYKLTYLQINARLHALSYEKRVKYAGKGKNKVWALPGSTAPLVAQVSSPRETTISLVDRKNHGWKPNIAQYEPLVEGSKMKLKDKLMVEYPEDWRHSMFCSVTRLPDANGNVQVWNLRDHCFSVVDVTTYKSRGWKVARVLKAKDIDELTEEVYA